MQKKTHHRELVKRFNQTVGAERVTREAMAANRENMFNRRRTESSSDAGDAEEPLPSRSGDFDSPCGAEDDDAGGDCQVQNRDKINDSEQSDGPHAVYYLSDSIVDRPTAIARDTTDMCNLHPTSRQKTWTMSRTHLEPRQDTILVEKMLARQNFDTLVQCKGFSTNGTFSELSGS